MREGLALSWLLLVSVPVLVFAVGFIVSRMIPGFRRVQERTDDINRVLREQIAGIRVVRAFVRERSETARFATTNDELTDAAISVGKWMVLMFPTVMLVFNASSVAVLWFGAGPVDDGSLQIGSLTAFLSYLMQILMAVMMATFVGIHGAAGGGVGRSHRRGARHGVVGGAAAPPGHRCRRARRVELRDVDVLLPRRRGSRAPRRVVHGRARPDDGDRRQHRRRQDDARQPHPAAVRRHERRRARRRRRRARPRRGAAVESHRVVPQTAYLFSGTIASNLRYGRPDATDEEMWDALEVAQAADFVRALPDGLQAPVAQGGTNFSGGQRQRLAIARALIRRPEIYVFDDAFSALDLGTDARLRAALAPRIARRRGDHRRPARLDDHRRRPDRRARGRRGRRRRPPRRAARHVPDVRRDRRVASQPWRRRDVGDQRASGDAPTSAARLPAAAGDVQRRGPMANIAAPTEKAVHFRSSLGRLVAQLRPDRLGLLGSSSSCARSASR